MDLQMNLRPAEVERLKKEPFKTLVPHDQLREGTVDELRGWREPKGAYILMEKRQFFIQPDASIKVTYNLHTLNVEERPEQIHQVRYYMTKGARVIHWAHFPKLNDEDPMKARKARAHSGPHGRNPWDELEAALISIMRGNPSWKEEKAKLENEKNALEAKLQAALAEKAKAPKGAQA
jgi:hypothetical protein